MAIILGIDPGSQTTGYGVIECQGNQSRLLTYGTISGGEGVLSKRLSAIYSGLQAIIREYQPSEGAIEDVFIHANPQSALILGHARGAALLAMSEASLTVIAEYPTRLVKKSIVGTGAATKIQVQFMVQTILNSPDIAELDASDALAVALCHAHSRGVSNGLSSRTSRTRSRRAWTRHTRITS